MKNQTDIINSIKNSDIYAFEKLFHEYYSLLYSVAVSYVRNDQVAEEIVDDLFYHIWEIRKKLEVRDDLKSYLLRAVYNRSISYLRKMKKEQKIINDLAIVKDDHLFHIASSENSPLHLLINRETNHKIQQIVEELPDKCREVFLLSRQEGLSYDQIADRLNISKNTVKTQIKLALQKLRDALDI